VRVWICVLVAAPLFTSCSVDDAARREAPPELSGAAANASPANGDVGNPLTSETGSSETVTSAADSIGEPADGSEETTAPLESALVSDELSPEAVSQSPQEPAEIDLKASDIAGTPAGAEIGPEGTCGEGHGLQESLVVNATSGLNVRAGPGSAQDRIDGFANLIQVQVWSYADEDGMRWACATGLGSAGGQITGWVASSYLAQPSAEPLF
jgi:hypothetical protein